MCVVFWWLDDSPNEAQPFSFVLVANRDEYFNRESIPAHFWRPVPILAGKDAVKGGTWLGITKSGRLATVTNLRQSNGFPPKSRGALVADFLENDEMSPMDYANKVAVEENDYAGFNLLLVDIKSASSVYTTNSGVLHSKEKLQKLVPGDAHGLCNEWLNCPTKKVSQGRIAFENILKRNLSRDGLVSALLDLASDRTQHYPDDPLTILPSYYPLRLRRQCSSIFIDGLLLRKNDPTSAVGTRTTTVVVVGKDGNATFVEKTMRKPIKLGKYEWDTQRFDFKLN
ncbi:transport and Golgi organization 2 homolog [Oscarella lobularis]|uniref:transport and Golgi organization 2 homolog n=1 Tax=Oscarella lobularis TaxID=121494 RepID=UPI0033134142